MSNVSTILCSVGYVVGTVWELTRYALKFGWAMVLPKALLAARLLAAESQLAVELYGGGEAGVGDAASLQRSGCYGLCSRSCWTTGKLWCTS